MPRISAFHGIEIYMYNDDHAPPHFHAVYAEFDAEVRIVDGEIEEGELPPRIQRLVRRWASLHRDELFANWALARIPEAPHKIEPLA